MELWVLTGWYRRRICVLHSLQVVNVITMKERGPSLEPWGILPQSVFQEETWLPTLRRWHRWKRYDANQARGGLGPRPPKGVERAAILVVTALMWSMYYVNAGLVTCSTKHQKTNKTKMLRPRPRPRPIKQQQDYITKKTLLLQHACLLSKMCKKNVKKWYDDQLRLALFLHLLHEKIQVFITFQHYPVTQHLSGTTVF